jgi:nucleoid DNA-binding protein
MVMYRELYQYLILHKQLNLPGIGTFSVEKRPEDFDIADKIVRSPAFTITLLAASNIPPKNFFTWLGSKLSITEREAVIRFNDFLFELNKQFSSGNKLEWSGVGTLSKGLAGDIRFETFVKDHSPASSVPAIKVLRENAEHTIRVGEEERTSVQMKEILHHAEAKKGSWWWPVALIILIISIIFIGYYFSTHGLNSSAAANQQKVVPK